MVFERILKYTLLQILLISLQKSQIFHTQWKDQLYFGTKEVFLHVAVSIAMKNCST